MKKIPALIVFSLVASIIVMRAPVTCVGPVAEVLRESLRMDYVTYGVLSSLPVLCFGFFGFISPILFSRISTSKALFFVLALMSVGLLLRFVESISALMAGTLLIGAGIAMLNTVIPVILRRFFPEKVSLALGVFTAATAISSFAGAFLAIPLQQATGSYVWTLSIWVLFSAPAAAAWFLCSDKELPTFSHQENHVKREKPSFRLFPLLSVVLTMSLQSMFVYSLIAWLPPLLMSRGMTATLAGNALALVLVLAFVSSLTISLLIRCAGGERNLSVLLGALCFLAVPFWFAEGIWPLVGSLIMAIPHGARFSLALILIAKKARTLPEMLLLSSISQGIGYALAATGPFICGYLYKGDGDWSNVLFFLAFTVLVWCVSAFYGFGKITVFNENQPIPESGSKA